MFEQARKEHHSLGNTGAELLEALNLAEIEHRRGETQRAITIVRETLAGPRAGTDKTRLVLLNNFAGYLAAADDLSGAVAAARAAIVRARPHLRATPTLRSGDTDSSVSSPRSRRTADSSHSCAKDLRPRNSRG
jgi:hypothetical protein